MTKNKATILGIVFILIGITAAWAFVRFVIGGDEDTWICQNGQWVKHGNPSAPKPTNGCTIKANTTVNTNGNTNYNTNSLNTNLHTNTNTKKGCGCGQ